MTASGTIFSAAREAIREAFADAPPSENRCETLVLSDEGGAVREVRIYWDPPPLPWKRYSNYSRVDQQDVLLASARHHLPGVSVRVVRGSQREAL